MPYSIRLLHKDDLSQVTKIDQEAFSTQWPPANYKNELKNQLAHYIVACDETKTAAKPPAKVSPYRGLYGLIFRIIRRFGHHHPSGNEPTPAESQYIVGFAGIWVLADEAHITNIAVRKSYQRRGLGELLLISLFDLARELKADIMTLEVRASNVAAQNLYYKCAFAEVGTRYGYYTDNREDGLIMSTESLASASLRARLKQLKQAHRKKWGTANRQLPT